MNNIPKNFYNSEDRRIMRDSNDPSKQAEATTLETFLSQTLPELISKKGPEEQNTLNTLKTTLTTAASVTKPALGTTILLISITALLFFAGVTLLPLCLPVSILLLLGGSLFAIGIAQDWMNYYSYASEEQKAWDSLVRELSPS